MSREFYTYLHCKPDGTPFYVGKGSNGRAYDLRKSSRKNKFHEATVDKYGKKNIRIFVFHCDSEQQAFADEIQQIDQLKRDGYALTNCTRGGEGVVGRKHTQETREKMSHARMGNTYSKGVKRPPRSIEHRRKLALANTGKSHSDETKEKISLKKAGIPWSEARRAAGNKGWHRVS